MGLFSFIRSQLIDVIEWLDDSNNILVWRFPDEDHEIKMGAQLTVREGQAGVFINEGRLADVFPPGLYSLSTQNMPVMTTLRSWKYGFDSPFKAEVYFVNTRQYLDMKWGTQNPITMRDPDFGMVRVRAFGVYAIKVIDPAKFMREVVGTDGCFKTNEIEGQLRRLAVSQFTTALGKSGIPVLDLAGNYDEIANKVAEKMRPEFEKLGVTLSKFIIENISLPPAVEKAIDERSSIGAAGNLGTYTQYQAAHAMRDAAKQSNGIAGMGVALSAGLGVGQMFTQGMAASQMQAPGFQQPGYHQPQQGYHQQPPQQQPPQPQAAQAGAKCPGCGAGLAANAKFCGECGTKIEQAPAPQAAAHKFCSNCGNKVAADAKFCGECGNRF